MDARTEGAPNRTSRAKPRTSLLDPGMNRILLTPLVLASSPLLGSDTEFISILSINRKPHSMVRHAAKSMKSKVLRVIVRYIAYQYQSPVRRVLDG